MATATQSRRDISRLEDYLEAIYNLNEEKGYISTSDISDRLGVRPPTVSSMVANLAKKGYLVHERYRGMKLTDQGARVARSVIRRHQTTFEFLSMLGIGREIAYEDAEGIEHHLHPTTIHKFERLVDFFKKNPEYFAKVKDSIGSG
jgi:Mn-dependent DtxR family transcriptional regulator